MLSYRQNDEVFGYSSLVRPQICDIVTLRIFGGSFDPQVVEGLHYDHNLCDHNPLTLQTDRRLVKAILRST